MEIMEDKKVNLKQYKGHHRRFPWTLLIRMIVAFATIAMIWYLMEWTKELNQNRAIKHNHNAIEIEYKTTPSESNN